jgi:hypothetical protein
MGDMCVCVGPPDTIVLGSAGVLFGGKPAARMGDTTAVMAGCPTVLIGETGSPVGGEGLGAMSIAILQSILPSMPPQVQQKIEHIIAMKEAAKNGTPFVHKTSSNKGFKWEMAKDDGVSKKDRKKIAFDFYKKSNPNMDAITINSHLKGIDFSKPVKVVKIPPEANGELSMFQKRNQNGKLYFGQYFSTDKTTTPSQLGISDKYNVRNSDWTHSLEVKTVELVDIKIPNNKPVTGLKSTSKKIEDNWSLKDKNVSTEGGGIQVYVPKSDPNFPH